MSAPTQDVELLIGGMTCASCAVRIEKKLNRLDGVTATVNYATEKAKVTYGPGVTPEDLVATVEKTGYTAELPRPRVEEPPVPVEPVQPLLDAGRAGGAGHAADQQLDVGLCRGHRVASWAVVMVNSAVRTTSPCRKSRNSR